MISDFASLSEGLNRMEVSEEEEEAADSDDDGGELDCSLSVFFVDRVSWY